MFNRNRKAEVKPPPVPADIANEPPLGLPPRPAMPAAAAAAAAKTAQPPFRETTMPPAAPPASAAPASFRPAAPAAAAMAAAPARPAGATLPAERRMLVVGRGITLQGTITDCERLVVEGTVEATLNNALEVSIAATGVFKGEVEIDDADISGAFDGTMTCRNTLMVRSSGRISGAVRCRRLSVEEGGQISGRIEMLPAEPPRATAPASAASGD